MLLTTSVLNYELHKQQLFLTLWNSLNDIVIVIKGVLHQKPYECKQTLHYTQINK